MLRRAWLLLSVLWSALILFMTSNWTADNQSFLIGLAALPWVLGLVVRWIVLGQIRPASHQGRRA